MPWPAPGSGFQVNVGQLPTTIAWGTDGMLPGVIVKSMRSSRMIEEIKIENGTGITSTQILLHDGDQVEITVVDDRAILTWPDAGTVITLINPINIGVSLGGTENFVVVNNDYNAARKQEGERVFLCKAYKLGIPVGGAVLP